MSTPIPTIALRPLSATALIALADQDHETAEREVGLALPQIVLDHTWLWNLRREQVRSTPEDLRWIARIIVDETGSAVGHAGFHGGPDDAGMVEAGYSVDETYRGRGFAKAALAEMMRWARSVPEVRTLRATVSPRNATSLAIVRAAGLIENGEQWDDEDGLELIFEIDV